MREIKFRAWDKYAKLMIMSFGLKTKLNDESLYNYVMQYTGLKDKNGVEIYEGDIIETSYLDDKKVKKHIRTVVTWDDNNYDYGGRCIGFDFNSFWNYYEVIGNIYENKELLDNK